MRNEPSHDPRDEAIRTALRDAAALAGVVANEFHSTYQGPQRAECLRVLGIHVEDLGGSLKEASPGVEATFPGRRIAILFGAGHDHA